MALSSINFDVLYLISEHLDAFSICNLASTSTHFSETFKRSNCLQKASQSKLHITFRNQHVTVCLDEHCYCFCKISSSKELNNKEWTYCCSLHIDAKQLKVLSDQDYIYSALKFIAKILRNSHFQVVEVEIIEHPWYITTDFETEWFTEDFEIESVEKLLNEISDSIQRPLYAKIDPSCEQIFGAANNFRGYFRAIHRRLLENFGFQNSIWIINDLLRDGWIDTQMDDSILQILPISQKKRYRELEARLLLPEKLKQIFSMEATK